MKVLHLSSEKNWRGGEQQIAYLVEALSAKGIECHVACRTQSVFQEYCIEKEIPYTALPFTNQFDFATIRGIAAYANKHEVDLIHMHSGKSHGLAVLASLLGCKGTLILSRRVDVPPKKNFFSRWKYNHASIAKIVCVSHKIKELVSEVLADPTKVVTVHSGIDLQRFNKKLPKGFLRKQYQLGEEAVLMGNTSALAGHKDYPTFIKTAKLLVEKHTNFYFFIVGEGEERTTIEKLIAQNQLEKRVFMTGFLSDIPHVLADLDIFLMPSKTEGLGTSILDAFATKTPVVATRAGGIPESVIHEKTGLLAEIGDEKQLSECIERFVDSMDLRNRLTENAYQFLLDNFTKEKVADKTLAVYQEALSDKNR